MANCHWGAKFVKFQQMERAFKNLVNRGGNTHRLVRVRVMERQQHAVQEHSVQVEYIPKIAVMLHVAMTFVANNGVVEVGKMFAYLVAAARFQLRFYKRKSRSFMAQPDGVVYF